MTLHHQSSQNRHHKTGGAWSSPAVSFGVSRTPNTVRGDTRPTLVVAYLRQTVTTSGQSPVITPTVAGTAHPGINIGGPIGALDPNMQIDHQLTFIVDPGESYVFASTGTGTNAIVGVREKVL